ncbi:YbhB/YbcL family Raf kinase inhibitor-like protein [Dyella mobilis]|uniref:YbhB/YbcL family Raf kinase inhibitor-like protein n=1 Tax=Dyella mobilis TaxID=1849582 RepID=A0ABS2KH33_9GAMM|nr:YbhB/YbcL family Raf kinase inhibitor-like protein [Dyella mobilis]MBM7130355.1 YbhB/YbcL family Raf kinase inhibitor-like protein [Dyella mobilis]GLQ96981.1 kinase inhibitor [Dyella mobilis]
MKRFRFFAVTLGIAIAGATHATDFTVSSTAFTLNGTLKQAQVLRGFGCSGQNISPALTWKGEPPGTQSFAVTAYDPDAPTGSGWWHWVVFDIPNNVHDLAEGAGSIEGKALPPMAKQGRTDFGPHAYGGACPPAGDKAHRYVFTVYALKIAHLDVPADASPAMIGFMIHGYTLGSTSIQASYGR